MCNLRHLMRFFINFREFEVTNDERMTDKRSHGIIVDLAASEWNAASNLQVKISKLKASYNWNRTLDLM